MTEARLRSRLGSGAAESRLDLELGHSNEE